MEDVGPDVLALLADRLSYDDVRSLCASNSRFRDICKRRDLINQAARRELASIDPLAPEVFGIMEHYALIQRGFKTHYSFDAKGPCTFYDSTKDFTIAIVGLPPPKGTKVHVVWMSNVSYDVYSDETWQALKSDPNVVKGEVLTGLLRGFREKIKKLGKKASNVSIIRVIDDMDIVEAYPIDYKIFHLILPGHNVSPTIAPSPDVLQGFTRDARMDIFNHLSMEDAIAAGATEDELNLEIRQFIQTEAPLATETFTIQNHLDSLRAGFKTIYFISSKGVARFDRRKTKRVDYVVISGFPLEPRKVFIIDYPVVRQAHIYLDFDQNFIDTINAAQRRDRKVDRYDDVMLP